MDIMHDFKDWLNMLVNDNSEGFNDLLGLYRTLNGDNGYGFQLEPIIHQSGWHLLTCSFWELPPLRLSEKAVSAMAKYIDAQYETGIESEAAYRHARSKND
jgi:hypothetical protein